MYTALSIKQDDIESRLSQIRENFKFFGAPVGMIVTIDKAFAENGWGHVGMFIQNICLSAVECGMGTCLQESWLEAPSLLEGMHTYERVLKGAHTKKNDQHENVKRP